MDIIGLELFLVIALPVALFIDMMLYEKEHEDDMY